MAGIAEKTITVPSIIDHFTDEQLNREYHSKEEYANAINNYGVIYKIVNFSELDKAEEIKNACYEWIRKNFYDGVLTFTVKAVDLKLLGYPVDKILVGDQINVEFIDIAPEPITKWLTVLSINYDLFKPENTSYKIGIPDVSANEKYRNSITISQSTGTKKSFVDAINETDKKLKQSLVDNGLIIEDL